jgi:hypothetical protein
MYLNRLTLIAFRGADAKNQNRQQRITIHCVLHSSKDIRETGNPTEWRRCLTFGKRRNAEVSVFETTRSGKVALQKIAAGCGVRAPLHNILNKLRTFPDARRAGFDVTEAALLSCR